MKLPEHVITKLSEELARDQLLTPELASEVTENLAKESPINWNILLSSQLEAEKGDSDEA